MIEVRNLTKKYRELIVIDNFSHTFDKGKVYGIMGENGAGKSTLFRCIAGIEPYDGSVFVSDNSQVGYMSDTPFLLLTIMLQDNDIIIMDEPFNGIDLAGTIVLRQWLKEMKAEGKCVILSSHIVSAIADICDEITYIHKGKVVADFSGMSAESIEHYILEEYFSPVSTEINSYTI